jgi:hypothetical protein
MLAADCLDRFRRGGGDARLIFDTGVRVLRHLDNGMAGFSHRWRIDTYSARYRDNFAGDSFFERPFVGLKYFEEPLDTAGGRRCRADGIDG